MGVNEHSGEPLRVVRDRYTRAIILRFLHEQATDGRLNSRLLRTFLECWGLASTLNGVVEHLEWLEREGFVALERIESGGVVAALTQRGADLARGITRHDGVERPELP